MDATCLGYREKSAGPPRRACAMRPGNIFAEVVYPAPPILLVLVVITNARSTNARIRKTLPTLAAGKPCATIARPVTAKPAAALIHSCIQKFRIFVFLLRGRHQ